MEAIDSFFQTQGFMPHGICLSWKPAILWTMVIGNAFIALSYFTIPFALIYLILKRKDIGVKWIFALFGLFILACGFTHVMSIVTLWNPMYGLEALVVALTGIVSFITAILIWPLLPILFKLPSPWQLEKMNDELNQSNKELEEFAYAASHDLKAPLRVIDNTSKWLEEDLQEHLTSETRENMVLLRGRVKRMERLLDDLLEYSRIGRKEDERFTEIINGDALINNILELLSPSKNFTITVSPNFKNINVKRMPLQQVIMNLVSNAIKHHDKKEGHIDLTVEESELYYTFAVKDDGPGITKQFHEQIFKIFQTLKPRDQMEGSGMGLAMVKKNIEVFGGTIHLDSAEGKGSIFSFTWPKALITKWSNNVK